jgi:CHRD domain-containing protein
MTNVSRLLFTTALAAACLSATAALGATSLSTTLSGPAEKPNAGDPDGKGTATLKIDGAKGEVCYELAVSGIAAATMAHIHKAPADAAGPVAVPLAKPDADGKSKACATVDKAVAEDIAKNPSAYYVNVHNAEFPAGAVRGQLK